MFEDNKAKPTILWYWYEIENGSKSVYSIVKSAPLNLIIHILRVKP